MTVLREGPHILIVEDDAASRSLLNAVFAACGFEVTTADSVIGASGLIASARPDVIVLDLGLPYRSGARWLSELKVNPETASIPVVMMTALPDLLPDARREQAFAIIRKPFRTRTLLKTVQAACALQSRRLTIDSTSSQPLGRL